MIFPNLPSTVASCVAGISCILECFELPNQVEFNISNLVENIFEVEHLNFTAPRFDILRSICFYSYTQKLNWIGFKIAVKAVVSKYCQAHQVFFIQGTRESRLDSFITIELSLLKLRFQGAFSNSPFCHWSSSENLTL